MRMGAHVSAVGKPIFFCLTVRSEHLACYSLLIGGQLTDCITSKGMYVPIHMYEKHNYDTIMWIRPWAK